MEPFASSFEHLSVELQRVELLLQLHVEQARRFMPYVKDEEASSAAERAGEKGGIHPNLALARRMRDETASRGAASAAKGIVLRLDVLARCFGLDHLDVDVLLLALLPEVSPRAGDLYACLQDDAQRRLASVDIVLSLLCSTIEERAVARRRFGPDAPLFRHELLRLIADERPVPSLSRSVQVDERVLAHLHDSDAIDPRLRSCARLVVPRARLDDLCLPPGLYQRLRRFLEETSGPEEPAPVVCLQGPRGAGKRATVQALCQHLGKPVLCVDSGVVSSVADEQIHALFRVIAREALLLDAVIHYEDAHRLPVTEQPAFRSAFEAALEIHRGLVFLSSSGAFEPSSFPSGRAFVRIELPRPSTEDQVRLWRRALASGPGVSPEVDLEVLTSTFRLTGGQIFGAAAAAKSLARFRGIEAGPITLEELRDACRACSSPRLSSLASRVRSLASWDDLIVPRDRRALLEEMCAHVQHRSRVMGEWGFERSSISGKGPSALFAGPPGTGKSMAAGVIARTLGLDLYQVDLSLVVSKYIGDTEKQLGRLFDEAQGTSAVLFFDEADALFGKRTEVKDAHDRNANLETSYLLQRIDAYDGVVILASNFTKNIDDAFVRRLRFIVDFPMPAEDERLAIWQRVLPAEAPRGADLDLHLLARRFEIAGAIIRNIALRAAFLAAAEGAPVLLRHALCAAQREYQKMGKVADPSLFTFPAARRAAR